MSGRYAVEFERSANSATDTDETGSSVFGRLRGAVPRARELEDWIRVQREQ